MLLSRRCRRRLYLTLSLLPLLQLLLSLGRRGRLHLTFPQLPLLQLLLSRGCRRRLDLTLLRRWRWLHFSLLRWRRLHLALLGRSWRWLALTWLRRRRLPVTPLGWRLARSLRWLLFLLLISLWRLRQDEGMIKRCRVGGSDRDSR